MSPEVRRAPRALLVCAILAVLPCCAQCSGDCPANGSSALTVAGAACDACTVEFGTVTVGLQEHRRVDMLLGCDLNEFVDGFTVEGDPAFQITAQQVPEQAGAEGFFEVTFTPTDAGEATATLSVSVGSNTLDADLHATAAAL